MKITKVECFGLEAPLRTPFAFSQGWVKSRRALLVRIETADGAEGWGEIYCQVPPQVYVTLISELLAPRVVGCDPWDREVLWHRLYNATIDCGQRGLIVGGLSGIDIAMWDLAGQDCGQPVHRLLGGLARSSVEIYATGLYRRPGDGWVGTLPSEALSYVETGVRTLKMKVGFGLKQDLAAVHAVRDAIGPDIALAVDANHAYKPTQATMLGHALSSYNLSWFEEPVSPEDISGYAEVRARQPIPVAGGELAFGRMGFRNLLEHRAADILQPDLGLCGGLSEGQVIAQLAHAWNTSCWAHVWGTGVAQAAALHFLGWIPNEGAMEKVDEPLLEWDCTENPLRTHVVAEPPSPTEGRVDVPTGPGLGVTIDRKVLDTFKVAHATVTSS